jgi:hypothetical protein
MIMNLAFSGDCRYIIQRHFIDRKLNGKPFETNGHEYFKTLSAQKAVCESASKDVTVSVN